MSRYILTVRERGYIVKTNGSCWRVLYNADGSYYNTYLVSHSCSESRVMAAAAQLGEFAAPARSNGFNVLRGTNMCPELGADMIVQVRNGGDVFRATLDPVIHNHWLLTRFDGDVNTSCGDEPVLTDPIGETGRPLPDVIIGALPPIKDKGIMAIGAGLVAIGIVLYVLKMRK